MLDELFIKGSILLNGNVPPDHLKLAFSIFATYPSALLFKHIKSSQARHLFSTFYTLFIMLAILHLYSGFIHITTTCVVTYFFMKYYKGINGPWINFIFVMASLSLCHIQRQIQGYEGDTKLDYSGALMIVTIKLTSFGFNISDGRMTSPRNKTPHTEQMKIEQYPTWIEYFGWLYYFGGFLTGPTCEYMDYYRFIHDKTKRDTIRPALALFLKSLVFIIVLVLYSTTYNYFEALKPEWKLKYKSLFSRIMFIQLSSLLTRCKYYCIWSLAEGACILSGLGFNGYDKETKKPKWDKLRNVNVLNCELAQSYKSLAENWNLGANNWLRNYVYLRLKSGSSSATVVTYTVSAMWHGFLPGYYMFFITVSVLQIFARQVRRTVRPLVLEQPPVVKKVYDLLTWIASMGILNMFTPCFDLLHVSRVLYVWKQVYYCHFIVIGVSFFVFYCSKPYLISLQKKKKS